MGQNIIRTSNFEEVMNIYHLHLTIGVCDSPRFLSKGAGGQDHIGEICGLCEKDILDDKMLQLGQCGASMCRVGVRHRWVLAHLIHRPNVAIMHRIDDLGSFGPPVPIVRVRDIDHAIEVANSTAFGLSSGVCTNRMDDIIRFIKA